MDGWRTTAQFDIDLMPAARTPHSTRTGTKVTHLATNRFGSPPSSVAALLPACRLPVAFVGTFGPVMLPCCFPVASLLLSCCSPVAALSTSYRCPAASCCYPVAFRCLLSFTVAMRLMAWRLPVALLLLSFRSFRRSPVAISCCLPAAFMSPACGLPVAFLSPPCCLPVASLLPNLLPCCSPVACLSLACPRPVASLLPPCCLPVVSLSLPCLPMCYPVAPLLLFCALPIHFLVGSLSPTCRFPVAFLSTACRLFGALWSEEKGNLVAVEIFPFCLVFHHLVALDHLHYGCLIL